MVNGISKISILSPPHSSTFAGKKLWWILKGDIKKFIGKTMAIPTGNVVHVTCMSHILYMHT